MLNKNLKKTLGNIIIVSAPSGAGKTAICKAIIKSSKSIAHSISYTTRFPRKGERNGREYFFVNEATFKKMVKEKKFAEWAKVHNNYYGTSKDLLLKVLESGKDILLEIDVQGGVSIKKQYSQAYMIFIMTPNFKTLEKRLMARNKDSKEVMGIRLNNARKEIEYLQRYEYLVINKKLGDAVDAVKTIIKSLKYKVVKNQKYFAKGD